MLGCGSINDMICCRRFYTISWWKKIKMQLYKRSFVDAIGFSSSSNWRWTKLFLSLFGAWPLQSPTNRYILISLASIVLGSMFIPEGINLIMIRNNTNEILACYPLISLHITATIVIANFLINSQTIKILIHRVRHDWQFVIFEAEKKIIQNEQHDHGKILIYFISYLYFGTALYVISRFGPIIFDQMKPLNESQTKSITFHAEFFIDKEKYAVPLLIHEFIISPIPITAAVAFDALFATSIHHACSIFKIIGSRIQISINNVESRRSEQEFLMVKTEILKAFIESIRMHIDILQFVEHLQTVFSTSLFMMNIMSMVNLSITAYQAVNDSTDSAELVGLGFYAVGQLVRLYFRCWHGQMLINSSESVFDSVYQNNWYDLPTRLQRFIVIILTRGKKQTRITAAKIFDMSMENFAFVVKTAISYFTVLRSIQ